MKIRIKDNSIRLRLTQTEIKTLQSSGVVEAKTVISHDLVFGYSLRRNERLENVEVTFENQHIIVNVPNEILSTFTDTDQIGIYKKLENSTKEGLIIVIEKDFKCLDNTTEDQSDMFPNPNSKC